MENNPAVEIPILVVDDEESLRHTFKIFLKREGYGPIILASNFEEAVGELTTRSFDLVISDIVLGGNSGIDLLKRIRELNITCPVIMVTGYPHVDTASEALRFGAFDYIQKPVEKDQLLKTSRLALQQYKLQHEKQKAEEEKDHYRAYLDTLLRSVSDSIITIDQDLNIIKMNQAARSFFSPLNPAINEGGNLSVACADKNSCFFKEDAEKVLRSGIEIKEHRIEFTTETMDRKVISICISPLEDGRGSFHGVVIVIRDMTCLIESASSKLRSSFHRMIGASPAMQTVYTMIENVGKVDSAVLITGESGTGKELATEALHLESHRKNRPLVKVDCTAIPENLLESELFGHKKGSFTGADQDRMGRILQADGGTLFLDEIGDIPPMMQLRLLRFLQEKTFYPVGRDTSIQVDVRIIAATNVNLREKVQQGKFREDLYFRLRVIDIILPPLRERAGDIPLLANNFIQHYSRKMGKPVSGISDQAMTLLTNYTWPGNIRELEHVIERSCVLCNGSTIASEQLPIEIQNQTTFQDTTTSSPLRQGGELQHSEKPLFSDPFQGNSPESRIIAALKKSGGNKAKAARLLSIDRSTLYRKLREMKIDLSTFDL
ncbi:PAS, AAA-type ATPase, and DNA-binding domain-containing transcriptional regulator [Desulfocapsa sulfexigens DSM 10523]|uniref:PAS, AAA-type ATPase, and DNA-binding domain-containing transcriptional regulator n=1 Tax=Desulfocapsa sulfexigens (strain DSM 10523 / SB164P1) TaxID=1167006 RepID=M1P7W8_DESSD|nr:sigma 54-interacting transcriptional regulator [Desulfocapsa sulfexigens]AGF79563.1 PAS, AAA-type ATPase, and DNA-binding domain-containing transcriptional regulator [Desulfocapsa sulfexigens DSM 10523]